MYMDQLVASEKVDGNAFVREAIEQVKNEIKEELRSENRTLSEQMRDQELNSTRELTEMERRYEEVAGDRDQLSSEAEGLRSHVVDLESQLSALREGEEARKSWWVSFITGALQVVAILISFIALCLMLIYVRSVFWMVHP